MGLFVQSLLFLFIAFFPIHSSCHQKTSFKRCSHNENSQMARQLNRFQKIPEIGTKIKHFAHVPSALYDYERSRLHHRSEIARSCIINDFNNMDRVLRNIERVMHENRQEDDLNIALNTARTIFRDIRPVYDAIRSYELENETRHFVVDKCERHDPHTTIGSFEEEVMLQPKLFQRLAKGVQYDLAEFQRIAADWTNRIAVCAGLTKICDALRGKLETSLARHYYEKLAADRLQSIADALNDQIEQLRTKFNRKQVETDIDNAVQATHAEGMYSWKETADAVRDQLTRKYYLHHWAVLAMNDPQSSAAFAISGNTSFSYTSENGYFIVAHAAFADKRCSNFARIFSNGAKLKTIFQQDARFHRLLLDDDNLSTSVSILQELLQEHKFHAEFFIGVVSYDPDYYVSFDPNATSHHIESLRNPSTGELTKIAIIGWC